jgi:hypothetical protein
VTIGRGERFERDCVHGREPARIDILDDGEIVATFVPLTGRDEILYDVPVDEANALSA